MDKQARSPVSFLAHVARLPRKGMPVELEATESQRAALAKEHGLSAVRSFHAAMTVEPWKRNGVRVVGTVTAEIVQECVVSLEPLESRIDEPFQAIFLPEQSRLGRDGFDIGGEIVLEPEGPDSPETFSGDTIDVGALAEEYFGLAIDPYPRKAAAELPRTEGGAAEGPLQEQLRKLKNRL